MTDDIQIDKGIPVPARAHPSSRLAALMRSGDSALVSNLKDANRLRAAIQREGAKVSYRKVDGGYRVWRLS